MTQTVREERFRTGDDGVWVGRFVSFRLRDDVAACVDYETTGVQRRNEFAAGFSQQRALLAGSNLIYFDWPETSAAPATPAVRAVDASRVGFMSVFVWPSGRTSNRREERQLVGRRRSRVTRFPAEHPLAVACVFLQFGFQWASPARGRVARTPASDARVRSFGMCALGDAYW